MNYLRFTFILLFIVSITIVAQKKLKTEAQLAKLKTYRSLEEAMYNKRAVYKLNLDGQNLSELPAKN